MALENIDVLRIDTKEDVNNLRELKAEIKELRSTLEGLEIGSEEYEKVADRLYQKQQYLSDVMRETTRSTEDAKGSYNALNKQLGELRKTYRALGEEERNSDFGTDILLQIQDLDKKLKDSDAQMGQYFRNVGNYTNSIVNAFKQMGISANTLTAPIASLDSSLGVVINDVTKLIPIIRTATASATTGLKGIKAAIASTGIGLLILAVGELAAHWEDVTGWIKKAAGWTDEAAKAEARHAKAMEDTASAAERITKELSDQARIRASMGLSEWENLQETNKGLVEEQNKLIEKQGRLWETYTLNKNSALEANRKMAANALEEHKAIGKEVEKLDNQIAENNLKITESANKAFHEAEQAAKGEEAVLRENYENTKKLLEQQGLDTTALTKKFNKELAALRKKSGADALQAQKKLNEEAKKLADEASNEIMKEMDKAFQIQKDAWEARKTAKQKEIDEYNKAKKVLEEWNLSTEDLTANHNKKMAALRAEDAEKHKATELSKLEFEEQMRQERLKLEKAQTPDEAEQSPWNYDAIVEQNNAEFEAFKALNEGKIALNKELMKSYEENSEEYKALMRENDLLSAQVATAQAERDEKNAKAYKNLMKAREEATKNMISSASNLFKNLSAAMGESTKMGKGFAIASATIDTIAAAVSGFRAGMNQWKDAGAMAWMAPVQGAINAAAALAAGYAQVQKIMSVDTSGNASSGGGMATALAMPNIEGLNSPIDYTRQVTTQTEQEEMNRDNRVYILESDIQESNTRVRVREEETTF